jgi:hypothetical protein
MPFYAVPFRGATNVVIQWSVILFGLLGLSTSTSGANETPTWKYLSELSAAERQQIDPRTETPRHATIPYLPAEPYPFEPPYTAEEMGLRVMEFPHMPRWNCVQIEDFASLMPSGYLLNGKTIVLAQHRYPEGLLGQITAKTGEIYAQWLSQDTAPPESLGNQMLMRHRRTDKEFTTKTDLFGYAPAIRRVRRFPQPRRQDRFPNSPLTYDDFLGRDAWEFSWRIIGVDVLTETVRFPKARKSITLRTADGAFTDVPADSLKLMGNHYPHYTPEGGVKCYLLEARAKPQWLENYYVPRILYWVDQHYFYPLRTEQYGPQGELVFIEERIADLLNPALKERGYHNIIALWWNAPLDFLSYAVHDGQLLRKWSEKDLETFFNPDFMRRVWFPMPMKTQATVHTPEEFFLRPRLLKEKFPQERHITLPAELEARIAAQDAAGHIVFTVTETDQNEAP